jgi:cysteinyl-tRNA synthetase
MASRRIKMYFSVRTSLKILGKVYTPCICYKLPEALVPTIEKLAKEGKAYIYEEKVAFQNGKVLPSLKEREEIARALKKEERKAKKEAKENESSEEDGGF